MQEHAAVVPSLREAAAAAMAVREGRPRGRACPVVDIPELRDHVDLHAEARSVEKRARAAAAVHGKAISDHVQDAMDQDGYAGRFSGTYEVAGNTHRVKCVFESRFSIRLEDREALMALLGSSYGDLVEERLAVRLRPEVLEDEALAGELMALVGWRFAEFFESELELAARPGAKERIYEVVPPGKLAALRALMQQHKPKIITQA